MPRGGLAAGSDPVVSAAARPRDAWREIEWLLLVLLVLGIYFSRLGALTVRGEESRWARVAQEMIDTGDWIVPRQQGEPFPDRPPLNSWAMIAASQFTGGLDSLAIRLPSAIATLLTTLLIYFYSRNFLSRVGAFAAAAAYPTMGQVLQLGRMGESDVLLTLCLSGALFAWHFGYACRSSPRWAWIAGYALAALAGLAKGPQGPVYFVAITTVFLLFRRDWKCLLSPWHLTGVGVFALILGAWQLPFTLALDSTSTQAVWSEGGQLGARFHYASVGQALRHWGSYPFEVFGCLLPWSFLLPVLCTRWFRQNIGSARPMVVFLLTACAVTFPTCWLPAESRPRYFMSLYPCLALLVGLVIQRSWESRQLGWWQRSWDQFLVAAAATIGIAGLFVAAGRLWGGSVLRGFDQSVSLGFALVYALAALVAATAVLWSRRGHDRAHAQVGILAVTGFLGMTYTGVVVGVLIQTSNDPSAEVAAVRELIPPGERLVSLGRVHHLFAYYYQEPIELRRISKSTGTIKFENTYFCFTEDPGFPTPKIPFAWDRVTEISCERARSSRPLTKVVVGKCKTGPTDTIGRLSSLPVDPVTAQPHSEDPPIQDY